MLQKSKENTVIFRIKINVKLFYEIPQEFKNFILTSENKKTERILILYYIKLTTLTLECNKVN